jgi:ATP-dependent DNA helicase DinG
VKVVTDEADARGGWPAGPDPWHADVTAAFGPQGALARADEAYVRREAQGRMADAIAQAIDGQQALVVEAGTGVGKTYAYLVPLLLSGRRALVSTATKSLQDQLFSRDLPRVQAALGVAVRAALLKGRESYLCLHRLERARHDRTAASVVSARTLARIERWAQATTTGDVSEVEGIDERSPVLPWVTSTRDNCLGSACPQFQDCHVVRARREALAADIVVVNHHLFFADLAVRESGMAELLPSVDVAVFDEAHQLVDTGVQFLGTTVSTSQMIDLARDVTAVGLQHARGLLDWAAVAAAVDRGARDLRMAFGERAATRAPWPSGDSSADPAAASTEREWRDDDTGRGFAHALNASIDACRRAAEAADTCSELDPAFATLSQRARRLADMGSELQAPLRLHRVRWVDVSTHHVRLIETPLDIGDALQTQRARVPRAWIFTSATLGADDSLSWFTKPCSLEDARVLRLGSPYDHARHARVWVCKDAPRPDSPEHAAYVAQVAWRCASRLHGRTMVLTTTLRSMARIAESLRAQPKASGDELEVLVQGESPKRAILERMRRNAGAIVVASQSFWEGIDVSGDALQCVIVDKLPFPPPNDPLVQARARRVEVDGGNAFVTCFVAEAAVSLKQGAGRLIRSETDRGLLVVCDVRMATMGYGKRLLAALPPMTPVRDWDQASAWLDEIAVPAAA